MNKTGFDSIVRAAAAAAALVVSGCATAKPAPDPAPAKPAQAAPVAAPMAVAPSPAAMAPAPPPPAPAAMPTGKMTRLVGVLVAKDAEGRTLMIKDDAGQTRTFRIARGAHVTKGGNDAPSGLEGITLGDRVRLKVGGDVAASVHVMVKAVQ